MELLTSHPAQRTALIATAKSYLRKPLGIETIKQRGLLLHRQHHAAVAQTVQKRRRRNARPCTVAVLCPARAAGLRGEPATRFAGHLGAGVHEALAQFGQPVSALNHGDAHGFQDFLDHVLLLGGPVGAGVQQHLTFMYNVQHAIVSISSPFPRTLHATSAHNQST
jgi:hypothetical protein